VFPGEGMGFELSFGGSGGEGVTGSCGTLSVAPVGGSNGGVVPEGGGTGFVPGVGTTYGGASFEADTPGVEAGGHGAAPLA
jgi:hypothetical protein